MDDENETVEELGFGDAPQGGIRVGAMTMSPTIGALVKALAKAQADVKPIKKDKNVNAGQKQYKFADLASVLEATTPALAAHGIVPFQGLSSDPGCVHVTTMLAHESGEWMSSTLTIPTRDAAQDIGSAITYGRRYSIMAMCGTAPEDDDGKAAHDGAVESGGRSQRTAERRQNQQTRNRPSAAQDRFTKLLRQYQQEEFGKGGNPPPWQKICAQVSGVDPWPDNPTEEQFKSAIGKFEAKMGGGGPS